MKRLLVLTSRFPYPLERGDKLRIYHQIKHLSEESEIYLFSISNREIEENERAELAAFCREVHVFRVRLGDIAWALLSGILSHRPFQVHYFYRRSIHEAIRAAAARIRPHAVLCQLLRMAPYAEGLGAPSGLDYMDAFSLGMKRRAELAPWWQRPLLRLERRRLLSYEKKIYAHFEAHAIISNQDREALPLANSASVAILPNGVDSSYFAPMAEIEPTFDLVYVGNMGYFPNVQAAKMLVKDILPKLVLPAPARLLLAGARPAHELLQMAAPPRVEFTGWVEDIRMSYASGKVFAAPLFAGSGQQNKILEAMCMGIPCVVTEIVNRAIGGTHGTHLLIANDLTSFVACIQQLLDDELLRKKIGQAGRVLVMEKYDWVQASRQLARWIPWDLGRQ